MKTLSFVLLALIVLFVFITPVAADALSLRLNVKYPRIPVPGGSFDLNKAIEKQNLTGEQVVTLGTVIIFVFVASIWVSGFVLLGSLLYTGVVYTTSGASPGRRAKALDRLNNIFWGIGILLFAYIIVFIVSPDIVKLKLTGQDNVVAGDAENPPEAKQSNPNTDSGTHACKWVEGVKPRCIEAESTCYLGGGYQADCDIHKTEAECHEEPITCPKSTAEEGAYACKFREDAAHNLYCEPVNTCGTISNEQMENCALPDYCFVPTSEQQYDECKALCEGKGEFACPA